MLLVKNCTFSEEPPQKRSAAKNSSCRNPANASFHPTQNEHLRNDPPDGSLSLLLLMCVASQVSENNLTASCFTRRICHARVAPSKPGGLKEALLGLL